MRTWLACALGYAVGNLPDDGLGWSLVKLVFTVAMFVLLVRITLAEDDRA